MYIITDKNNYVTTASWGSMIDDGIKIEDFEFIEDMRAYQYIDGEIILDKEKLQQLQNEQSSQEEIQELQDFLSSTDFIALHWLEEKEFGVDHHRSRSSYNQVMQQRQAARAKIRQLEIQASDSSCLTS